MQVIRRRTVSLAFAALSLLAAACGNSDCTPPLGGGTLFRNAEVEPSFAVNPANPSNLIGVWQQDRYSNGGARGITTYVSFDAGNTWTTTAVKFSRCTGGTYERASDPWISISPAGTAYQQALAFDASGGNRAVLASRSSDGGRTWSNPAGLQVDTDPNFALDKGSITADRNDASFVYAVWDRVTEAAARVPSPTARGPAWFTRSADAGQTWEAARQIYDPGADAQTIGNIVAVLPDGTLMNVMQVSSCNSGINCQFAAGIAVLHSTDKGVTWPGPPITVASVENLRVVDPKTQRFVRTGGPLPAITVDSSTGAVHVVWEDSRFSKDPQGNDLRNGIALSTSLDGGQTWSTPIQANRAPAAVAFTPAVSAAGGLLAVSYYDTRDDDPADPSHFLVSAWLATSPDQGTTWAEMRLAGPFDLQIAPFAEGYFLGDYEGLAFDGSSFLAFFAAANSGNASDPTSILFRRVALAAARFGDTLLNSRNRYGVPLIRGTHQVAPRSSSARAMAASTGGEKK
ncbi:MAG TPA: sialidase family protein [Myxococcales bacterium]|jgi:hypothetical protein|nr:sialidase family protein [Myxococcales bacterium]